MSTISEEVDDDVNMAEAARDATKKEEGLEVSKHAPSKHGGEEDEKEREGKKVEEEDRVEYEMEDDTPVEGTTQRMDPKMTEMCIHFGGLRPYRK